MSNFSSADTEQLFGLLSEELEFYAKIRNLTEEQAELLAKDDIEAFDNSLNKRETLIEKIKGLHQESNPLMQSYASFSSGGNKTDSKIDELKKQIRQQLEICARLNDENLEAMKIKKDEHTKKIDEQSAKRKGIGGYAQSVPNSPEMFDKKS